MRGLMQKCANGDATACDMHHGLQHFLHRFTLLQRLCVRAR